MSLEASVCNMFLPSCNKGAMTREQSRATTGLVFEGDGLWAASESRKSKRLSQRLQKKWACLGHGLTERVNGTPASTAREGQVLQGLGKHS